MAFGVAQGSGGGKPTQPRGSSANSTSTHPGSGETFTGTLEPSRADGVTVSCQSSTSGTLYFDFSVDGTNVTTFPTSGFSVAAGIHEYHRAVVGNRHFRVRFVSDTGTASYLRIHTTYGPHTHLNAPVNQTIGADADSMLVRTFPEGISTALGRVGGVTGGDKFGYIAGLGTSIQIDSPSTWVDLWAYGGQRTSPTTSFTPYMASDDNTDTGIDITWVYQDADGVEQTVTVATDGSDGRTPVSLGVTATEVYRGWNASGTDLTGNISCVIENDFTNGVPDEQDEVVAHILAEDQQTQVLAARVPANRVLIPKGPVALHMAMLRNNGSAGSVNAVFQTRETGGVWRTREQILCTDSVPAELTLSGLVLTAGTDYRVRIRDVSDSATFVTGSFRFDLVEV